MAELNKRSNLLLGVILAFALSLPAGLQVYAAEIAPYENAQFGCVVKLTGLIESGDAEKLATVINAMASDNPASPVSRVSEGLYKRSKLAVNFDPKKRICLDSTGGNLAEGIRLADMIYEVLGTAIEPGAKCLSACSIAFMAGSESTESDAGVVASRVMDATARLGFHAPDLTVQEGSYDRDTVQGAFYVAVNSVGEILRRSGEFKFPYTLVGEMLRTRPQEFFYIDTVNKAARWHIDVANTVGPAEITPLAISNACNNWYRFHADQVATNGLGDGSGTERWGWVQDFKPRKGEFSFSEEGFGQEGATKCHVFGELKDNGDLSGGIRIGENEIGTNLNKWIVYDQSVRLEDLALSRNASPFRPVGNEGAPPSAPGTLSGACLVVNSDVLEDFEPCTRVTETSTSEDIVKTEVHAHIWPSGGKTIVVEKSGTGTFKVSVNGIETSSLQLRGKALEFCQDGASKFGVECQKSPAACYPNSSTGKLFCFVPGKV